MDNNRCIAQDNHAIDSVNPLPYSCKPFNRNTDQITYPSLLVQPNNNNIHLSFDQTNNRRLSMPQIGGHYHLISNNNNTSELFAKKHEKIYEISSARIIISKENDKDQIVYYPNHSARDVGPYPENQSMIQTEQKADSSMISNSDRTSRSWLGLYSYREKSTQITLSTPELSPMKTLKHSNSTDSKITIPDIENLIRENEKLAKELQESRARYRESELIISNLESKLKEYSNANPKLSQEIEKAKMNNLKLKLELCQNQIKTLQSGIKIKDNEIYTLKMLISTNKQYGNKALTPNKVYSREKYRQSSLDESQAAAKRKDEIIGNEKEKKASAGEPTKHGNNGYIAPNQNLMKLEPLPMNNTVSVQEKAGVRSSSRAKTSFNQHNLEKPKLSPYVSPVRDNPERVLLTQIENFKSEIAKLTDSIKGLTREKSELNEKVKEADVKLNELSHENRELKASLEVSLTSKNKLIEEMNELKALVDSLRNKQEDKSVSVAINNRGSSKQGDSPFRGKFRRLKEDIKEKPKDEQTDEGLKEELEKIKHENSTLEWLIAKLKIEKDDKAIELNEIKAENSKLSQDLEATSDMVKNHMEDIKRLEDDKVKLNDQLIKLQGLYDEGRVKLEQAELELKKNREESVLLKEKMERDLATIKNCMMDEQERTLEENDRLKSEIMVEIEKGNNLLNEIMELKCHNERLNEKIKDLESELVNISKEANIKERVLLEQELNEVRIMAQALENEKKDLNKTLECRLAEQNQLSNEKKQLEEQLKVIVQNLSDLEKANSELEKANSDLAKSNIELEKVNFDLKVTNLDLKKANSNLEKENSDFAEASEQRLNFNELQLQTQKSSPNLQALIRENNRLSMENQKVLKELKTLTKYKKPFDQDQYQDHESRSIDDTEFNECITDLTQEQNHLSPLSLEQKSEIEKISYMEKGEGSLKKELDSSKERIRELESFAVKYNEIQAEIGCLRNVILAKNEEIHLLKTRNRENEKKLSSLTDEIDNLSNLNKGNNQGLEFGMLKADLYKKEALENASMLKFTMENLDKLKEVLNSKNHELNRVKSKQLIIHCSYLGLIGCIVICYIISLYSKYIIL